VDDGVLGRGHEPEHAPPGRARAQLQEVRVDDPDLVHLAQVNVDAAWKNGRVARDRCYDFSIIFAEKISENIGVFDAKQSKFLQKL
jgi:hypothetical protein